MQFTQIKESCLYSSDLERSENFYAEVLGLEKISAVKNRHVFFKAGSSVLLIFNPEETKHESAVPPHFGHGQLHIAFEVTRENYESTRDKLLLKGIKIEHEHEWPRGYKSFYFRDPDENCIEIVEVGMWGN